MDRLTRNALIGAAIGVLLLCGLNYAVFHIAVAERLDASIFNGFGGLRYRPHVSSIARHLADLCNPSPYVYLCVLPVAIALLRRRWDIAVVVVLILLGANETTELLKPFLHQTRPYQLITGSIVPEGGSWPSGHATASMSLALCTVLAAAPWYRGRAAVLGAGFAVGVTYSFLTLGWHYPSDAVGGFLMASTWTCLGVAGLSAYRTRRPVPAPQVSAHAELNRELVPILGLLSAGAAVLGIVLLSRSGSLSTYAHGHERFLVGIVAIACCALMASSGLVLVLRRYRA